MCRFITAAQRCLWAIGVIGMCALYSPSRGVAAGLMNEKIVYHINPVGVSEFQDLGLVEWEGRKVNKTLFRTRVLGFDDTETIYSDPETFLPLRVERDIAWPLSREYIVEQYHQQDFTYTMKKYKRGKVVEDQTYSLEGPIHNAILLPSYLRRIEDLKPGWTFKARFPQEFIVTLSSLEEISVPAGKFEAYHFTSRPSKFEIWISRDDRRLPLQIKGLGGYPYTMKMTQYVPGQRTLPAGQGQ